MIHIFSAGWKNTYKLFAIFTWGVFLSGALYYCASGFLQTRTDYTRLELEKYREKEERISGIVGTWLQDNSGIGEDGRREIEAQMEEMAAAFEGLRQTGANGNWRGELAYAIRQAKTELFLCEQGALQSDTVELAQKIAFCSYLLEQDIPPKIPPDACDGLNVLVMYGKTFLPVLASVGPLLFGAFQMLTERRQGGIKLLLQIPVSRRKILAGKSAIVLVQSTVLTVVPTGGIFLICTILFGLGDGRYPISYCNGSFLITMEFLWKWIPFILCAVVFFSMLGILLAVWIENEAILLIGAIGIPLLSAMLQNITNADALSLFSVSVKRVILDGCGYVVFWCMLWGVLAVICLAVGMECFGKRDEVT